MPSEQATAAAHRIAEIEGFGPERTAEIAEIIDAAFAPVVEELKQTIKDYCHHDELANANGHGVYGVIHIYKIRKRHGIE